MHHLLILLNCLSISPSLPEVMGYLFDVNDHVVNSSALRVPLLNLSECTQSLIVVLPAKVTHTDDKLEMNPSWSPDGKRIAFDVMDEGAIYIVEVAIDTYGSRTRIER